MKRTTLEGWNYTSPRARRQRRLNWANGIGLAITLALVIGSVVLNVAIDPSGTRDPMDSAITTALAALVGFFFWVLSITLATEARGYYR
jgi:hypothetical protein